jgi:hypothetical protein
MGQVLLVATLYGNRCSIMVIIDATSSIYHQKKYFRACLSRMRAGVDSYWNRLNILGRNDNCFPLLLATTGSNVALVVS